MSLLLYRRIIIPMFLRRPKGYTYYYCDELYYFIVESTELLLSLLSKNFPLCWGTKPRLCSNDCHPRWGDEGSVIGPCKAFYFPSGAYSSHSVLCFITCWFKPRPSRRIRSKRQLLWNVYICSELGEGESHGLPLCHFQWLERPEHSGKAHYGVEPSLARQIF